MALLDLKHLSKEELLFLFDLRALLLQHRVTCPEVERLLPYVAAFPLSGCESVEALLAEFLP